MQGLTTCIGIGPETDLKELVAKCVFSFYKSVKMGCVFSNLNTKSVNKVLSVLNKKIQKINNLTTEEVEALADSEYTEEMAEYELDSKSASTALKLIEGLSNWNPENKNVLDFRNFIFNEAKPSLDQCASEVKTKPIKMTEEEYRERELNSLKQTLIMVRLQKMVLAMNNEETKELFRDILNSIPEDEQINQND